MTKRKKRVLLVDDETPPIRELKRAFEVVESEKYQFEVYVAANVKDYFGLADKHEFDIAVIDIRLGVGEEGIDTITAYHRRRWPATVIIVYSAFPGIDAVSACVRAMKMGASDCIDKNADDSVRRVVEAAICELESQSTGDNGPTSDWLTQHFDDLKAQFGGCAVAFVGNEVVSHAATIPSLRKELASSNRPGTPYIMVVPAQDESA